MFRSKILAFAMASLSFALAPALVGAAAEKTTSELQLKTERVIIFKDGYSLVIKRGTATTDKAGEVFTDEVPDAAVLGSFWAVPEEGRLVSMLAGWKSTKDTDEKQMPCTQPIEILLANKGKRAKIELHDKTLYSGVIQEVLVDKTEGAGAAGANGNARSAAASRRRPPRRTRCSAMSYIPPGRSAGSWRRRDRASTR